MDRLVRMTRRVAFSSGHRYWHAGLSTAENQARFGEWASPFSHGHNYTLWLTVEGPVDPLTGMVVNIKRVDDLLKAKVIRPFDGRSLNDEVPFFAEHAPSVENILAYVANELQDAESPGQLAVAEGIDGSGEVRVDLVAMRLDETPLLYGEYDFRKKTMTLTRVYEFAAAHRLHSPKISAEENVRLYGKCNNLFGHGHNYLLEVTVSGPVDPETGMMVDIGLLDAIVEREVVDRYDHKNLNEDIPEFAGQITSTEVVIKQVYDRLEGALPIQLERVRLHETARNIFEISRP